MSITQIRVQSFIVFDAIYKSRLLAMLSSLEGCDIWQIYIAKLYEYYSYGNLPSPAVW